MGLPKDFDVILCDGIREEKRKKLTIFGLYAGNDIVVNADTPKEDINLNVTFLFRFRDGEGNWKVTWKILDDAGNEMSPPEVPEADFLMKEGQTGMAIIQVAGHKVQEFGPHKFIMTIGDKDYVFNYKIIQGEVEK